MQDVRQLMDEHKVCVVIPTYNNGGTIADIVRRTLAVASHVVVVVDGSTDDTRQQLLPLAGAGIQVVDLPENRGKGHALLAGFKHAIHQGYEYVLTLDADGQHFPEDIPPFIRLMADHPEALIVGARNLHEENMPGGNTMANRLSNFWFAAQTGIRLPDTQTGFRLYPLRRLSGVHLITARYEAELELLVFAAWAGVELLSVPVRVYYPPQGERVTHFRPFADFMRITLLNTAFCLVALFYGWPKALLRKLRRVRW
jgi:glycosyltransferase involved in cell wall biosynthesis